LTSSDNRAEATVNVRALVALTIMIVWAAVVVVAHLYAGAAHVVGHQFDYDNGDQPPTIGQEHAGALEAFVNMLSLPVAVVALVVAYSATRVWREQVSATVAVILAALATVAGIGLALLGVLQYIAYT
jgi:hypothetical protein